MKLMGFGIDAVEIARFERVCKRSGVRFLKRLFTVGELQYARRHRNPYPHLAARFAAKEACLKALPSLRAEITNWTMMEVRVLKTGQPVLDLSPSLAKRHRRLTLVLSISHTDTLAVAGVIAVEGD